MRDTKSLKIQSAGSQHRSTERMTRRSRWSSKTKSWRIDIVRLKRLIISRLSMVRLTRNFVEDMRLCWKKTSRKMKISLS
jgi:hypothetical protein